MSNYAQQAAQGRAKDATTPWSPEELEAVLAIEREREVPRTVAADYVRNGIMSVAEYDAAVKAELKPKTVKDLVEENVTEVRTTLKRGKKK